jgi:hypothetical protein
LSTLPNGTWKLLIGLSRFTGLRVPSEGAEPVIAGRGLGAGGCPSLKTRTWRDAATA